MTAVTASRQEASGQDVPEQSGYHTAIKDHSNNIAGGFNTIVIKTLNNESCEQSMKKHEREELNLDKRYNIKRIVMMLFLSLITVSLLFHLGLPLLYMIINPLRTIVHSYNAEVEFMININNDSIEETRYQHILVDTPDIYIEQETYDRKVVPVQKENSLPGENTAFNKTQVSKKFLYYKKNR